MHQQRSKVSIAALADPELPHPSTGAGLARDQSDPCSKLPGILKCSRCPHGGNDRRRRKKANTGDFGNSFAGRYLPHLLRQPSLDQANVGLQLPDSPELFV